MNFIEQLQENNPDFLSQLTEEQIDELQAQFEQKKQEISKMPVKEQILYCNEELPKIIKLNNETNSEIVRIKAQQSVIQQQYEKKREELEQEYGVSTAKELRPIYSKLAEEYVDSTLANQIVAQKAAEMIKESSEKVEKAVMAINNIGK